jgi:small subunit ribosomal protein S13
MIMVLDVIKRTRQNKNVINLLQGVYGIGIRRSEKLVRELTGRVDLKIHSFKFRQLASYTSLIYSKRYCLQNRLLELKQRNLRRLKRSRCYRGLRLMSYLPSHGQRTKSNGMTARYQGSGTFEYVPTSPVLGLKKICSYVRRVKGLKLSSERQYSRLLSRNFHAYQAKNPDSYNYAFRRGQLGVFNRLAGVKRKKD